MSQTDSPVSIAFDFQRNAIEQTQEAVKRGVETQREFGEALVDFDPAMQANERSYDAVRTIVDVYVDAVETAMPGQQDALGEFRATVDEQFDTLQADQIEALETLEANVREGSESADDLLEEFIAALDEQFETVLDAHADIEDQTVETVESLDAFEGDLEAVSESLEAIDGLGPTYASRLHEHGIDSFDALAEATVETVAAAADVSEAQAEKWIDAAQHSA